MHQLDLMIATRNEGKLREIAASLADLPVRLGGFADFPHLQEAEETGVTFAENAMLKARACAAQTKLLTIADDSGLEVDALDGRPGIRSARYAGENKSDEERMERLLAELGDVPEEKRQARFVCALAVADPTTNFLQVFTGTCEGRIAFQPRGGSGFGYDPIFIPDGYRQTFGELPARVKKQISHRARALEAAASFLRERIAG
ncbi:MAG: XTP/dITP diphosphatase [Pyrinomonadaceae bacterium]|nr:XTP/dITP diphosphatase [Pyrinomonadaceae bacterium]